MGGEWQSVLLGDVADLLTGYPFKSQHYTDNERDPRLVGGDNIVQGHLRWDNVRRWPQEMVEGLDAYWLAPGDVVLAMDRPWIDAGLKRAAIGRGDLPALLIQRTARLRGGDRLDIGFLRYVVSSREFTQYLLGVQTGTAVPHISPSQIRAFSFLLPPLAEQRSIANILGTLDDKIELNRKMSATLEAMARALFKSWFVDGPEADWKTAPLAEWVDVLSGGTPSKSKAAFWGGPLKWISPKAMTSIHADECDDHVSEQAVGNGTRIAPKGSTLVMVRGMGLHDGVRVSQAREDVTFNQDVKALVPRTIEADLLLFAMLDAQEELHKRVETSGHGTGKMPSEVLLAHPITMPSRVEQAKRVVPFSMLNDRIAANRADSRTLASIRDHLLPQLLSGALQVDPTDTVHGGA